MKWLRKLFRLPFPNLSRSELAATLTQSMGLNWELSQDLQRACLHGYWRFDHPLSEACPPEMKSRHPRLTEEQIQHQYRQMMGPDRELLVAYYSGAKIMVADLDTPVLSSSHNEIDY